MNGSALSVGQRVELTDGRIAVIRFSGQTYFQTGDWIGVELSQPTGKNDGSVKGERYFDCKPNHGMFLRPAVVKQVLEPTAGKPAAKAAAARNGINGAKSQDAAAARRLSEIAGSRASPTPSARSALSGLRSPTKGLGLEGGSGTSSAATSRTGTPPVPGRKPGVGPTPASGGSRPSLAPAGNANGRRTSVLPPASTAASRGSSRPSLAPPGSARAPASRPSIGRVPLSRAAPSSRSTASTRLSPRPVEEEAEDEDASQLDALSPRESNLSSAVSQSEAASTQGDDEDVTLRMNFAPSTVPPVPPIPPIPPDPAPRPGMGRRTSSPLASIHSQRTTRSTAQSTRQIEELEAKLRLLERRRVEDRDLKRDLEKAQQERDRYQGIIEKLQKKYQPQQQEIAELKKSLGEAESKFHSVEDLQAEHDSIMEMTTLDKEMAEEMAEGLKAELDALREAQEELQLEVEVLREENAEFSKEISPEERTSTGWLQLEQKNERLRDALIRLRDIKQDSEEKLNAQVRELDVQVKDLETVKHQLDDTKEKHLTAEAAADDLRQQLEVALGAEEMIEELTERNMNMQERIDELRGTIEELEDLRELNDELDINHVEAGKQMQEEIDFKDSIIIDRERTANQQQEALDDADHTINRFRELVAQMQSDLQDMQASKQISGSEAKDLSSKSRAMLDLNMKLQSSAAKTQVKGLDWELRKLEAQEASEHLEIVKMFLPESFQSESDSVLALLRFRRIAFKANVVHGAVKERIASFGVRGLDENVFAACDVADKLTWIAAMASRFVSSVYASSVDDFTGYKGALYELEPIERALNGYIDGLRRDDLREQDIAEELQRSIAVMSHLAGLYIKSDPISHTDELLMRTTHLQSQMDNTGTTLALIRTLVERTISVTSEDDEDNDYIADRAMLLERAESLASNSRNAKVVIGRTHRAIADLQARSLALDETCSEPLSSAESIAAQVASYVRSAGQDLQLLFSDESHSDPFSPDEVSSTICRVASSSFSLATPETSPFTTLSTLLRELAAHLATFSQATQDLDNTVEFDQPPPPWIARANAIKQAKLTSIDLDAELSRARAASTEKDGLLKTRDTELEEQSVRIEMLEARMKEASKRSARIAELERSLHEARDGEKKAKSELANAKREARAEVERAREELTKVSDHRGKLGVAAGKVLHAGAMGEGAVLLLKTQEHRISTLQGAVRYLQSDNLRLRYSPTRAEQTSLSWLHAPLIAISTPQQKRQDAARKEGKAVLQRLLQLTTIASPTVVDLSRLPENKLVWRPAKESARWQVEKRKEEWEEWRGWRREVIGSSKVRTGKAKSVVGRVRIADEGVSPRGSVGFDGQAFRWFIFFTALRFAARPVDYLRTRDSGEFYGQTVADPAVACAVAVAGLRLIEHSV
ncbi:hypothetical protein LTR95_006816 [Oleoguttula sp. CCFEE 5521]